MVARSRGKWTVVLACVAVFSLSGIPAQSASPDVDATGNSAGPFASTYKPRPESVAIINAKILTAAGPVIENGTIVIVGGRIAAVGPGVALPTGIRVVDAKGRWVTPGLIDMHSHIGLSNATGNEMSSPISAEAWVEHSLWIDDPSFARARESGITTLQILPGSVNLFGGRTVVLKNVTSATVEGMKFPLAPQGLKMACGENPARTYAAKGMAPQTPMESMAMVRKAFIDAARYRDQWNTYHNSPASRGKIEPPVRDLKLDTIAAALDGKLPIHIHCYTSAGMMQYINLSHEFGFKITAFHHATEAYRIAKILAAERIGIASWGAAIYGPKQESLGTIQENGAFIERVGGIFALHSDSAANIQHLHSDAGRLMALSNRMNWPVTPDRAIRWLTINPAKLLGVDAYVGSLEVGKNGDVVLWSRDPFSIYSVADVVLIDGVNVFDRSAPGQEDSDFSLGQYRREQ